MEKELQEYVERLKANTLETKDVKKSILRIKKYLDEIIESYEDEIADGDITKQQIIDDFLLEYESNIGDSSQSRTKIFSLLSQYEASKKIIKIVRKNDSEFNSLLKEAKRRDADNPTESLHNDLNINEEMITLLRAAIRAIKGPKMLKGQKIEVSKDEILGQIYKSRDGATELLKNQLMESLQEKIYFLTEYGYLDEYIEEYNEAVKNAGLAQIVQVKRNPFPDVQYDKNGNVVNTEEFEDMGVIDYFREENLKKLSVEELLVLELFWKAKYLGKRLELSEAFSTIEFLDLWPTIVNEDENAIQEFVNDKLESALKRDLALTYCLKDKAELTPELEQKYLRFLEKNNMTQNGNVTNDIQEQKKRLEGIFEVADEVLLSQCVLIDRLRNREIDAKDWGVVETKAFEGFDPNNEEIVIAIDMQSFRGPLVVSMNERSLYDFLRARNQDSKNSMIKLPIYKGELDEEYSKSMATLLLPTSVYFRKCINQMYQENPDSSLLRQLSVNFAGGKKIKVKTT